MRKSILSAATVVLLIAGVSYYFYGYRNRTISADINSIAATTDDATTTSAVKTAIALNKRISAFDTHVESNNSTVTLTGQVPTDDDKKIVEEVTRGTRGVGTVVNNLQVDPKVTAINAEKRYITDLEIKAAWLDAIQNNAELRSQQIKFSVEGRDVKLTGVVQTANQKTEIETVVKAIPNVGNVDSGALSVANNPTVAVALPVADTQSQKTEDDAQLAVRVATAFQREVALPQAQMIKVRANDGVVYISGKRSSRAENAMAQLIARGVTGTKSVVNNIEVTGRK
jgi:hyperosmotically inducible protein